MRDFGFYLNTLDTQWRTHTRDDMATSQGDNDKRVAVFTAMALV